MYIKIALPTNSSVHGGIVKDGWMPDESKFVQTVILFTFAKIFSKKKFFSGVGKSFWFGAQLYFTMNYRPKLALFAFQCLSKKKILSNLGQSCILLIKLTPSEKPNFMFNVIFISQNDFRVPTTAQTALLQPTARVTTGGLTPTAWTWIPTLASWQASLYTTKSHHTGAALPTTSWTQGWGRSTTRRATTSTSMGSPILPITTPTGNGHH